MEELLTLPGVGRKTANLVLILAFKSMKNICVDTHVHRISNRLGWVTTQAWETEQALCGIDRSAPGGRRSTCTGHMGRGVCRPVYPRCGRVRDRQRALQARRRDEGVEVGAETGRRVMTMRTVSVLGPFVCGLWARRRGYLRRPPTSRLSSSRPPRERSRSKRIRPMRRRR